ncbi:MULTISPECIES: 4-(cytidine 5'-diphospho)-2-C-methyl-D-erythritol kinase [unclassified Aureimonas]|uniref:4-(cytidine 5'-diphospho)-2-C-methyl-D-erythritol kinase n=1 Tax=unclassified Aureimonas TaxID=2615206 RepID=UPI0009E94BDA|nr:MULTISPECIES: 4-(cytidine 5'-diphospho)-2-C-methyl-D-erythritol kinase [unclassified Aureimonas]
MSAVAPRLGPAPTAAFRPEGTERASAKINLALHVTGRREDGYHLLDSLVAFAEIGDTVAARPCEADGLTLAGRFAGDVPAGEENILLQALRLARPLLANRGIALGPLALHLDKRLPVASGIGGGSADAAALLRFLAAGDAGLRAALTESALALGADVPMCLTEQPCRIGGIGETIEPLAAFPAIALVLVNPGLPVSTPAVFRALVRRDNPPLPPLPPEGFREAEALVAYLGGSRNDLEAPALTLAPPIGAARQALEREGALFSRMSGSGATVFGLFASAAHAERAARIILGEEPGWWVEASTLRPAAGLDATGMGPS